MNTKALLFCVLLVPVVAQAQTGTVLADIVPQGQTGIGRGVAFDGVGNLYYTIDGHANIYKVSTTGAYLANIPVQNNVAIAGPLAWDGVTLWTMNWVLDSFMLYRIGPYDGRIIQSCDISAVNPTHPAVASYPLNIGGFPDGLEWINNTLWINSDSFSGNWEIQVDTNCKILNAFNSPAGLGSGAGRLNGTAGIAADGMHLWHNSPSRNRTSSLVFQTDLNGARTGLHFEARYIEEDLAFDSVTFAPKCAIWGNQVVLGNNHLTAYEVPCPAPETPVTGAACDTNGDGHIDMDDLRAILAALDTHVPPGDPRDADGDGSITTRDARICATRCTNPSCGW